MDNNTQDDLFDLRLNNEGLQSIIRFAKSAKWVFVMVILFAAVIFAQSVYSIYDFNPKYFIGNKLVMFQQRIYPYESIIYCIYSIVQVWYYWKIAKSFLTSIEEKNDKNFNHTFSILTKHAIISLITLLIGFIMTAFQFYVYLDSVYNNS